MAITAAFSPSLQSALDILKALPETSYPTTNFNKITKTETSTNVIFTFFNSGVDIFNVTVTDPTGDFTVEIVEFNYGLLEDGSELLGEDGSNILMEG